MPLPPKLASLMAGTPTPEIPVDPRTVTLLDGRSMADVVSPNTRIVSKATAGGVTGRNPHNTRNSVVRVYPGLDQPATDVPLRELMTAPAAAVISVAQASRSAETESPEASPRPTPQLRGARPQVCFEVRGFGRHVVSYDDVVVGDTFLVLVQRHREGDAMYVPPAADPPVDMAMQIDGHGPVWLTRATGVVYDYAGVQHCVLAVLQMAEEA